MGKDNSFSFVTEIDSETIGKLIRDHQDGEMGIIPLRDNLIFPGVVVPITVGRKDSQKILIKAEKMKQPVAVFVQKNPETEDPGYEDLYHIGTVCMVVDTMKLPDGRYNALLQAGNRAGLDNMNDTPEGKFGHVSALPEIETPPTDVEYKVTLDMIREEMKHYDQISDSLSAEMSDFLHKVPSSVFYVNFICTNFSFSNEAKAQLMSRDSDLERAQLLLHFVKHSIQLATLRRNIEMKTQGDLNKQQREYFVNQEIKNLQAELGNTDEITNKFEDMQELRQRASKMQWPEKAAETFEEELNKLSRINAQSPDYNIQLNYLQTILALPWDKCTEDCLDLRRAERVLNEDHYGMEKVKERILEHLAVLKLKSDKKSPIICLYGPPGVGKTSLGKSIAKALKRKYVRMSLGGMHDESEIRGHRRTYIGSMPGRIIKNITKAGSSNPVFILDEIDKIVTGATANGDPSSALLEVLDPEQNTTFHDNFLDMDYDLSRVMFIATANDIQSIPRPLLDRMELIEVGGYITEEKIEIAKRHLFPKEKEKNGLDGQKNLKIKKSALEMIIERYTRESGVRMLEKQINKLLRKVALKAARSQETDGLEMSRTIDESQVEDLLGKPIFSRDIYQGNDFAGVVTGLAWTSVGGEILFIETSLSEGKGSHLTLTGNLGDVMKESASIALEYIRAHAREIGVDTRIFENYNIHIHVPEGAVPKDGPSAGITMATSIASALTQRKVRSALAMTGEITLRGKVLPVGGIREKILAAKRAGIKHLMLCEDNRKDIEEIPDMYIKGLDFHYVETVMDVLDYALLKEKVDKPMEFSLTKPSQKEGCDNDAE